MEDVVGKLEAECPEAILIAPAFTNTRWWEKLVVSGAPCLRLNKHFGLFRRTQWRPHGGRFGHFI